jgi:hypothetical protein
MATVLREREGEEEYGITKMIALGGHVARLEEINVYKILRVKTRREVTTWAT